MGINKLFLIVLLAKNIKWSEIKDFDIIEDDESVDEV